MIDKSGQWWTGSASDDLVTYLREVTADSYPAGPAKMIRQDRLHRRGRSRRVRLLVLLVFVALACSGAEDETGIRGCPEPEWQGPWAACAEARWVERVVEAAGYEINGGTGSALTAARRGRSFYIWAASTSADDRQPVDDGVRTSWSAQGFTFWVESGPRSADMKPGINELADLVEASRRIAPPPADA